MKSKLLLRTNLLLCVILAMGFAAVSTVNHSSNIGIFRKDIEHTSELTAESIYHQINAYFTTPVSVSLAMADDVLLKHFLSQETDRLNDAAYARLLQRYLNRYKERYGYNTAFLISTRTGRYYRFSGMGRTPTRDNPKDHWYYSFLDSPKKYELDVDNDETQPAERAVTAFVNCKIYDDDGSVMGLVGVGLQVGNLQNLLQSYKEKHTVRAVLIDETGTAAISSEHEGGDLTTGLFDNFEYINESNLESVIKEIGAEQKTFWVQGRNGDYFVASQYVPAIQWRLIVESDTSAIEDQFKRQIFLGLGVTAFILFAVLAIVNKVVLAYNDRLLKQLVSQELEYHTLIKEATKEMYADVYEFDITHGRIVSEETRQYLASLGVSGDAGYQQVMDAVAEKRVKEEFRRDFLAVNARENVLKAFHNGIRELKHTSMMNIYRDEYRWVCIRARLFFWNADQSVRMIMYTQDIHEEKERESRLLQDSLTDPLTGLYNRRFMEEGLKRLIKSLSRSNGALSVLLVDVDFFKKYNDTYGHGMGDECLKEVAEVLRKAIDRADDFVARYGGEEFIVILPNTDEEGARLVAERLLRGMIARAIPHEKSEVASCVTLSIGGVTGKAAHTHSMEQYIKGADQALYYSKSKGRNRYTGKPL